MNIGDREVLRAQIGEHVIYKKLDYSMIRYVCPDEGQKNADDPTTYHDFIGTTLMQYFPDKGVGRIRSSAQFIMAPKSQKEWRLALTLPEGFVFLDGNPETQILWSSLSINLEVQTKYVGNKMFVYAGDSSRTSKSTYYYSREDIVNNRDPDVGIDFKIKKIEE